MPESMKNQIKVEIKRELSTPPPEEEFRAVPNGTRLVPKTEPQVNDDQSSTVIPQIVRRNASEDAGVQTETDISDADPDELEQSCSRDNMHMQANTTGQVLVKYVDNPLVEHVLKSKGEFFPNYINYLRTRRDALQISQENWDFVYRLHNIFYCFKCSDILQWSLTLTCGHTFCSSCLTGRERKCPKCKSPIKSVRHEQDVEKFAIQYKFDLFRKQAALQQQPENPFARRKFTQRPTIQDAPVTRDDVPCPPVFGKQIELEPLKGLQTKRSLKRRKKTNLTGEASEEPVNKLQVNIKKEEEEVEEPNLRRSSRQKKIVYYYDEELDED